jgi:hypothetical protein
MSYDVLAVIPMFCSAFLGTGSFERGKVAFQSSIPVAKMDYSVKSLQYLDEYLDLLRSRKLELVGQDYTNTVLAAGCYLGEVIRRNTERRYRWLNYNDYFPKHPKIAALVPEGLGSAAVLADEGGRMTMPLNKIIRYLEEGPENNTLFYAQGELKNRK